MLQDLLDLPEGEQEEERENVLELIVLRFLRGRDTLAFRACSTGFAQKLAWIGDWLRRKIAEWLRREAHEAALDRASADLDRQIQREVARHAARVASRISLLPKPPGR